MIKREAKLCTALGKWWINIGCEALAPYSYVIEAKISVGTKPFNLKSGFKDHQLPTLNAYKHRPMSFKPSDAAMCTQPFDLLFTNHNTTKAAVAIMWIRRGNKTFYLIDPDVLQGLKDDGVKSIYEKDAEKYSMFTGYLKP